MKRREQYIAIKDRDPRTPTQIISELLGAQSRVRRHNNLGGWEEWLRSKECQSQYKYIHTKFKVKR